MRLLITGAAGMLALDVGGVATARGHELVALARDQLDITEGKWVSTKADPFLKAKIGQVVTFIGGAIIGRGVHIQDPRWERTAWAAHAAEVEVDTVTGEVKVTNYVAAHDVGRVINKMGLEQQIEGGVTMSLGSTLYE